MIADTPLRIGFVSTRLQGTDGVSLEVFKWADVLTELGHECFYFAGACDRPADRSRVITEADFGHPIVQRINRDLFDDYQRSPATSEAVHELWIMIKRALNSFVSDFDLSLLIVENALSLPMNVPLGLALTDLVAETNISTIAHHHDFTWERPRYAINAASDFLHTAFPPVLPQIHNAVLNSYAATELARRTGMRSTVIPNVMDFDRPPVPAEDYAEGLRSDLDISADEVLLLQPTRIVPRKRIERSIDLAARLQQPCALVISHGAGDEGDEYQDYLEDFARRMGARAIFVSDRFNHSRGQTDDGRRIYSLADVYSQADIVTYPSAVEGFGNAFLEAIYYKKPIVMCGYESFRLDIGPKGFDIIKFGEFLADETVQQIRELLDNPDRVGEMVEHNYALGRRHYSFTMLRRRLQLLIDHLMGSLY
jgi:glycosyltransferase involved in cell wall biosynthesis